MATWIRKRSECQFLEVPRFSGGRGDSLAMFCVCVCVCVCVKSLQLYLTLCDPVDCSPPGSSVHGILQARILEWVAMVSSRGSF